MPPDKHNANNIRPLMPTLASSRTAKTPLTPRLAASSTQINASQPRRPERGDAPLAASTPRGGSAAPRDDLSTPVKAFLSSNITPRSSSRKSRVGPSSAQSTPSGTPSGTPTASRPLSTIEVADSQGHGSPLNGLGIYGTNAPVRPNSFANGGSGSQNGALARSPPSFGSDSSGARENSPMFFHALDSRLQDSNPNAPSKKPVAFFYANGREDEDLPRLAGFPSPPLSAIERSRSQPQSDVKSHSPIHTPPLTTLPETASYPNPTRTLPPLRPSSPSKDSSSIHLSYRKGASQIIRPSISQRPSGLSILPGHSYQGAHDFREGDIDSAARRRSSAEVSLLRNRHAKSASLSSIDSVTPVKKVLQAQFESSSSASPSPIQRADRLVSNEPLPESINPGATLPQEDISNPSLSLPQSPTKSTSGQSALQHMNELAANARRERKVLDLEISNSSLLAINRQLEREVRKQKVELRRFRRLSRAGRFSSDTVPSSLGSVDGLSTIADDDESDAFSDMQEQVTLAGDNEEDISDSSFDEEALSPAALADRDAHHREKDEKILQLDLSRHRELLVDSQKMNQSLKRCLGWTEELINEGKKALEYKVRVSDVKLGGRVLSSEDQPPTEADADNVHGGTLLGAWTLPNRSASDRISMSSSRTDRDSGVELEGLENTTDLEAISEDS